MGRRSSKEAILEAAERVILRQGLANTTMESVAVEAGVSKGGLFYHFATKKDMLLQLMEYFIARFLRLRNEIYDVLPESPSRLLKATILASARLPTGGESSVSNILTLMDDVELRAVFSEARKKLLAELTEEYPYPEKVALAMLAVDGLRLMDIFGQTYPAEMRDRILDQLIQLIDFHAAEDLVSGTGV